MAGPAKPMHALWVSNRLTSYGFCRAKSLRHWRCSKKYPSKLQADTVTQTYTIPLLLAVYVAHHSESTRTSLRIASDDKVSFVDPAKLI